MSRLSVMPHPSFYEPPMPSGKYFVDDSRASSFSGIPASPPPSIGVPATGSIPGSPLLRNGTVIKNYRRTPSNLRPASKYKLKERAAPDGKWVFIVNGLKLKQWEVVAPRLLKQLSLVEVRFAVAGLLRPAETLDVWSEGHVRATHSPSSCSFPL